MRYIVTCASLNPYLIWQLKVHIYNICATFAKETDNFYIAIAAAVEAQECLLSDACCLAFLHASSRVRVHTYSVAKKFVEMAKAYPALYKPLGLAFLLQQKHIVLRPGDQLLLLDPDVVCIKYLPPICLQGKQKWYVSDCSSYMSHKCQEKKLTQAQFSELLMVAGGRSDWSPTEAMQMYALYSTKISRREVGGAHYVFTHDISSAFLESVAVAAYRVFRLCCGWRVDGWMAEMYAFYMRALQHKGLEGICAHRDLRFMLADNIVDKCHSRALLHLSGDVAQDGLFNKYLYIEKAPWQIHETPARFLQGVARKETASYLYAQWVIKYAQQYEPSWKE